MSKSTTASTSILEQAIFHYVREIYPDAENRHVFVSANKKKYEADIYVPSLSVAIEYDGEFWHRKREAQDVEKNQFFFENDIFLIRVRDYGLPELKSENGILIYHQKNGSDGLHTYEIITEVIHELARHTADAGIKERALAFDLSYDRYYEERSAILARIFCNPCEDNITKSCIFKCWDEEKNHGLIPENIPINTTATFWFRCPDGHSIVTSPASWKYHNTCDKNCSICTYSLCPFISLCPPYTKMMGRYPIVEKTCDYIKQFVFDFIEGKKDYPQKYGSQLEIYFRRSLREFGLSLIKMLVDDETPSAKKDRIIESLSGRYDQDNKGYMEFPLNKDRIIISLYVNGDDDIAICKKAVEQYSFMIYILMDKIGPDNSLWNSLCVYYHWVMNLYIDSREKTVRYFSTVLRGRFPDELKSLIIKWLLEIGYKVEKRIVRNVHDENLVSEHYDIISE